MVVHPQLHPPQMSSSLSLHTSSLPSSPTSPGSPLSSSATTSPSSTASSPPPSPFRRFHGRPWTTTTSPTTTTTTKGLNPTSSSATAPAPTTTTTTTYDQQQQSSPPPSNTSTRTNSANANANANSSLRTLAAFFLRRRPSKVDLALSEELSRCEADAVERQGLGLLEPRPVEACPFPYSMSGGGGGGGGQWEQAKPGVDRFVMGGIVEVMQGTA